MIARLWGLFGFDGPESRPQTRGVAGELTPHWKSVRLDRVGSVSGLQLIETHWDDALIEEQHSRWLEDEILSEGNQYVLSV